MAINERLIHTAAEEAAAAGTGNQEEGLILHLDANDVDSYDGDGSVWYDITDYEYTPAVDPSDYFNTVLYNNNASAVTDIIGVGFKPDLVWIKDRNQGGEGHYLVDSVRGISGGYLRTEGTNQQYNAYTDSVTAFIDDGFTVGADSIGKTNYTGRGPYVAWCFKAGGAPDASNPFMIDGTGYATKAAAGLDDGSSTINKASVNTDLGFSIIKFTTDSTPSSSQSWSHGLGVAPDLIIAKGTAHDSNWHVYSNALGTSKYLKLNGTDSQISAAVFPTVDANKFHYYPSSTGSQEHIAYCFASKRGVSKVGSYTGTNASNKVYTGFEPVFIMLKNVSNGNGQWIMVDNKRDPDNPVEKKLSASSNQEENDSALIGTSSQNQLEFNGDGFTLLETNGYVNTNKSGDTFIYIAFAAEKADGLVPDKADFEEGTATTGAELELKANDYSGSGNWLDSTSNDYDATINGATYVNKGDSDYFDFDGSNDYLSFSQFDISDDGDFTVELWVNPDSTQAQYANMFDYGHGSSAGFTIQQNVSNTNQYYIYSVGTYVSFNITANAWTHLVVTASGTSLKVYKDGVQVATDTLSAVADTSGQTLNIGRWASGSSRYWNGQMAQIRIYSTALTGSEVKSNYDASKGLYQYADLKLNLAASTHANPTIGTVTAGAEIELDANDYSGSGNWLNTGDATGGDATITGATYNDDESSDYFSFDGSSDYATLTSDGVKISSSGTVEFWIKPDNTSQTGKYIIAQNSNNNNWGYSIQQNGTAIHLWSYQMTPSQSYVAQLTASSVLTANKWHHVVVTIGDTAGKNKIYVDNVLITTETSLSGTLQSNSNTLYIGTYYPGAVSSTGWAGDLAQLRIYDSILSASDIETNYDATKEQYAFRLSDSTSNENHATLYGNPTFDKELGDWITFNGSSDYGEISDVGVDTDTVSLEVWARPHSTNTQYQYITMLGSAAGTQGGVVSISMNYAKLYSYDGNTATTTSSNVLVANKWHHIVVTRSGTSRKIYVNGQNVQSNTNAIAYSGDDSLDIARYGWGSSNYYFDGDIGQLKIYASELTADQIKQNYRFTKNDYPNGNNGNAAGNASWSANKFTFDGSGDRMNLDSAISPKSVSVWVDCDSTSGIDAILGHSSITSHYWYWRTGELSISSVDLGDVDKVTGWQHIVVTDDGTNLKCYLNKTLVQTKAGSLGTYNQIGGRTAGTPQYFTGDISKVKMYDKVLTQSEVNTLYDEGSGN